MASTLGTIQPFRYRGYVYDVETDLYYLRSRYYNQECQRFVNADSLIESNLYSYSENNPINLFDENGKEALFTVLRDEDINCYAYAFKLKAGTILLGDIKMPNMLQPGMASKCNDVMNKDRDRFLTLQEYKIKVITNMLYDAPYLGVNVEYVGNGNGKSDENSWLVALVIDYNPTEKFGIKFWNHPRDYHWYRKESNGTWSHKVGQDDPVFTDESGNTIYDPQTCDRGRYNVFVSYFRVTRKNTLDMENLS